MERMGMRTILWKKLLRQSFQNFLSLEKIYKQKVKLRNQFKYSERGCQTFNQPTRDRGVSTVPPQVSNFSCNVNRWKIYDAYVMEYMIKLEEEKKSEKNKPTLWKNENPSALRLLHSDELR